MLCLGQREREAEWVFFSLIKDYNLNLCVVFFSVITKRQFMWPRRVRRVDTHTKERKGGGRDGDEERRKWEEGGVKRGRG